MTAFTALLDRWWQEYTGLCPQADLVARHLRAAGQPVVFDHVTFRTFSHPAISIELLASAFTAHGYRMQAEYDLPTRRLWGRHFAPPAGELPRVFLSELLAHRYSEDLRLGMRRLADHVPPERRAGPALVDGARPWALTHEEYLRLADESPYAAWVAAFAFRPHHFALSLNHLHGFGHIGDFNRWLRDRGIPLDERGGEIKGSPGTYLESSATTVATVDACFSDGVYRVPGSHCEFVWRHPLPDGQLYDGFPEHVAHHPEVRTGG